MYICIAWLYMHHVRASGGGGQKRASGTLKLELQEVVSQVLGWGWGTNLTPMQEQVLLAAKPSL